uniref:Uncharacterized protein n=1 Tax=Aplanochytrium stocchinoi TaxID=215587 RepID=A0A7S3LNH0_9STRA|mmetsp:Transcript_20751/g.25163  ORF Transcript_20751/g.25163 Transcript_20751/m.25163 type:complete len:357 (+) Transcript_20751:61-1131(+)|eukprot:CAMPEP_0204831248 /NCGR_PEP_ID=MMETSP1346-20131115/10232_1 /ASSEMBLY_ACC=CAM_ASM_000771 /TAXON_ID=215587 /ORGANISM="Aplanochytrium stocchinoi, Strain GSBS06" /LENGTH=356 /DNA_ID=CAMNT_0051962131 /DNA_START=100 /DNA_END=1170 /DNA_ORIENTATION=+
MANEETSKKRAQLQRFLSKQAVLDKKLDRFWDRLFSWAGCIPSFFLLLWGFSDVASDIYLGVNNALEGSIYTDKLYIPNVIFFIALSIKECLAIIWFFELLQFPGNSGEVLSESVFLSSLVMLRRTLIAIRLRTVWFKLSGDRGVDDDDVDLTTFSGVRLAANKITDQAKAAIVRVVSHETTSRSKSKNNNVEENVDLEEHDQNDTDDAKTEKKVEQWGFNSAAFWVIICVTTHWISLSFSIASIIVFNVPFRDFLGLNCEDQFLNFELVLSIIAYFTTMIAAYRLALWALTFRFDNIWLVKDLDWDSKLIHDFGFFLSVFVVLSCFVGAHLSAILPVVVAPEDYGCILNFTNSTV